MSSISEVTYRKASESDISELVELRIKQLIAEGYPEVIDIREDLKEYFASSLGNGSLICWIGVYKDKIIATAGMCFYQLPSSFSNPTGKNAHITNVYTNDEFRRNGIASLLVDKLLVEAKALNFPFVKLHASSHGKGIYEKAGFVKADGYMSLKF